jgi:uncharacterized damage-inducible protein DinB
VPGFVVRFALVDETPRPDFAALFKQPATVQDVLASHEKSIETVREILPTLDDARLMTNWSATVEGKPVVTMPKVMVLRSIMLNHWIHHRGQLGRVSQAHGRQGPLQLRPQR